MGFVFRPVRGNWRTVEYTSMSTSTFVKGSLVAFGGTNLLVEGATGSPSFIGIALQASTDSYPAGKVQVAVPADRSAVLVGPIPTNTAASALSVGLCYGISKSGNSQYIDCTSQASAFFQLTGVYDSTTSRAEAYLLWDILTAPSESSSL